MALSNAQKQALWRERNRIVLSDDAEEIAEKLIAMDRRKLRTVHSYISKYLKTTAGLSKRDRENQDYQRRNERAWQRRWVAEGRSLADYKAGASDGESEVWKWRRAKGKAAVAAEKAAWLRDHPGDPLPEHLCELNKAKGAEYDRWKDERTLKRPRFYHRR